VADGLQAFLAVQYLCALQWLLLQAIVRLRRHETGAACNSFEANFAANSTREHWQKEALSITNTKTQRRQQQHALQPHSLRPSSQPRSCRHRITVRQTGKNWNSDGIVGLDAERLQAVGVS
jgi:hypothetical protein